MRIYKAKIISYNEIKAILECENCKAAVVFLIPLGEEFECEWCEENNSIDKEDVLDAKKKLELLR